MGNKNSPTIHIYNDRMKVLKMLPFVILSCLLVLYVQQRSVIADVAPPIRIFQLMGLSEYSAIELIHYFFIFLIVIWTYFVYAYIRQLFSKKPIISISTKGITIGGAFITWKNIKSVYFFHYRKYEFVGIDAIDNKQYLKQKGSIGKLVGSIVKTIFNTKRLPIISTSLTNTKYAKKKFKENVIAYSGRNDIFKKDREY